VQERVALSVGQLDKAEAFVVLEPFDDRFHCRLAAQRGRYATAARLIEPAVRPTLHARWALPLLVSHRSVVVEAMSSRRPEILPFIHDVQTLRPVDIEKKAAAVNDASPLRQKAAEPRAGARTPRIGWFCPAPMRICGT
jgi:hypothetical protein